MPDDPNKAESQPGTTSPKHKTLPTADRLVRADPGMPPNLAILGIVVGLALIIGGAGALYAMPAIPIAVPSLMLCAGFGLVLAAFGARAGGNYGGFAVVGSAALTVVLFMLLNAYLDKRPVAFVKKGTLGVDLKIISDVQIFDEYPFYSWRDRNNSSYRFVILQDHFQGEEVEIRVDTKEAGTGKEFFRLVGSSVTIAKRHLRNPDGIIQWKLDYAKRVITDGTDVIFSEPAEPAIRAGRARSRSDFAWQWPVTLGISAARAESASAVPSVTDLLSDEPTIRRNARDAVAAAGPAAVRPLMDLLGGPKPDYRIKLGAVLSLTDMLRQKPEDAPAIRATLKDSDIDLLVRLAGDDDKTTRVQASELLVMLRDQRIVKSSLASTTNFDDNGLYNATVVLKSFYPTLSDGEQKIVSDNLFKAIPDGNLKTKELLKSFSGKMPTVYLQIADETQRTKAEALQRQLVENGFTAPGIENVKGRAPSAFEVRYIGSAGAVPAGKVSEIVASLGLAQPKLKQLVMPGRDAGPVEVWFAAAAN